MMKTQLIGKLIHHEIEKMATMVSDDGLRGTKPSDDVIEYEQHCSFPSIIKCKHRIGPFSEIMHS
jgi:hypothetical protein